MFHKNCDEMIGKFERALHEITTETAGSAIFEHLPPTDLWNKTELYVTQLESWLKTARRLC